MVLFLTLLLAWTVGIFGQRVQPPDQQQIGLGSTKQAASTAGWVDSVLDQIKNAATCSACQSVLQTLKGIASLGDGPFVGIMREVCTLSKVEPEDVCYGSVGREGPIIASSLRQMEIGSKTAQLFCITAMGLCENPDVELWNIPFPTQKPPSAQRPPPSGRDPIKVIHFSDIHIDPLYVPGASTECGRPICCRPYTEADAPGNSTSPAGPNGDHNCDVPHSLEESMYRAIQEYAPDAAFAVFTGDIVDHAVWNTSEPYNRKSIHDAYNEMASGLRIVYGTAGNHEAHPANAYDPLVNPGTQWLYDLLSSTWAGWIGSDAASEAEKMGAYSVRYPHGNLRIISLNTNMYYRQNFWMYQPIMLRDPAGQISWLVGELDAAERAGENVYIIGHLPLGNYNTFNDQSHYLDQVIRRYSATIAAMFFGHTHVDEFQLSYSNYTDRRFNNALVTSYIIPSLTPTSGMPAFRVYSIDPDTFGVLDATTYTADMTNPSFQTKGPAWKKYYSAKEAYGPVVDPPVSGAHEELTAVFWHNVTEAMAANETVFDEFLARKSRGWKKEDCKDECAAAAICQLRAARSEDNCAKPQAPSLRKRQAAGAHGPEEEDECGASVTMATLSALAAHGHLLTALHERFALARSSGGYSAAG